MSPSLLTTLPATLTRLPLITCTWFTVKASDLAFYTAAGKWETEPGAFKVFVGGNSRDVKEAAFSVR